MRKLRNELYVVVCGCGFDWTEWDGKTFRDCPECGADSMRDNTKSKVIANTEVPAGTLAVWREVEVDGC